MTKRPLYQLILVAGTIALASACTGDPGDCEYNEETGDQFCNTSPITGPTVTPEPALDEPLPIDQ